MNLKMLIVDDLKETRIAMARYFEILGFQVDCASEQEEAEALISANRYDVVITDLQLTPLRGNEGLEIVRMLRHQAPNTAVIMLTAYSTPEVEKEVYRSGLGVLLNKPVSLEALQRVVEESLGGK